MPAMSSRVWLRASRGGEVLVDQVVVAGVLDVGWIRNRLFHRTTPCRCT